MPELFPPVKIKNGVLVDKDGDPVKHYEGADYRVINHKHESFPMPVNEDGTIRLPTPEEMEQMRANNQVIKQDPSSPEALAERFRAIEQQGRDQD